MRSPSRWTKPGLSFAVMLFLSACGGSAGSNGETALGTDKQAVGPVDRCANVVCAPPANACKLQGVCNPANGNCSSPNAPNGTTCDDGDPCTTGDSCTGGACHGTAVTCPPPNSCQNAGTCNPQTGACQYTEKSNGTPCSDGNACTTGDSCQAGQCRPVTTVTCAALDSCHDVGVCNSTTGQCSNPVKANGSACSDGNACTPADSCQQGTCVGGAPVTCLALDACHAPGTCDPTTGVCSNPNAPDFTPCSDGNACTAVDSCQGGTCVGAQPVACRARDACHSAGTCDPSTGACSNPAVADGTVCSDGNACTVADTCVAGACTPGTATVCPAPDQCHLQGSCDVTTGVCSNPVAPTGTACSDGNACTVGDACNSGQCVPFGTVVCQALDQCHSAGTCDVQTGQCSNPALPNGTACTDNNGCTNRDTCQAGACVAGTTVSCLPLDGCHDAGVCDPATGLCSNPALANGTACDDSNPCTVGDVCTAGQCVPGAAKRCTAQDGCHDAGVCDPSTGACSNPPVVDGTACTDNNACTGTDVCMAGRCVGSAPVICIALDGCHDAGVCNPSTGTCSNPPVTDGQPCGDGNACTNGDACIAGVCTPGQPVLCTAIDGCHDAGACDPQTGRCTTPVVANGSACDDRNPCTLGDMCMNGQCTAGPPRVCNAADGCHDAGSCDPATGLCSNPVVADGTACNDFDTCTRDDVCHDGVCFGSDGGIGVPTRTMGFFQTHEVALGACLSGGPIDLGVVTVSTLESALGVLWATPGQFDDHTHRSDDDQKTLLVIRQLLVATCNDRLFGADGTSAISTAMSALSVGNCGALASAAAALDAFNNSGDLLDLPASFVGGPATPSHAKSIASDPTSPTSNTCSE